MKTLHYSRSTHSGAALVVGLILLVVLTIMAISSMNTASLDLIMAGNEQFRGRAFTAAETGIERAWNTGTYDTSADFSVTATSTGIGTDKYKYEISRPNSGAVESAPPGNSEGTFGAVYFRIKSTGTSERNSQAVNTQELFEVVKISDELGYDPNAGGKDLGP